MSPGGSTRRLAWLAGFVLTALIGWCPAASAQPASRPTVVLLAVPGLQWADVASMPHLAALASHSSVGELSVKTSGSTTRCAAALLAVSAGNRTTAPTQGCLIDLASWPSLRAMNHTSQYDADVGELGTALQAAGIRRVAVGVSAVPMLANTAGQASATTTLAAAIAQGGVVGAVDQQLYAVPPGSRPAARAAVDATVAQIQKLLPPKAIFVVAGIADASTGQSQLHAVVVSGPGWVHTQLRSSAAGRAPYVQLIDIAPTILAAEGISEPSAMVGRPMQRSGSAVPSIAGYVDDNRHAVAERSLGQRWFLVMGIVMITMMILAAGPVPAGHRLARWLARLLAPAATVGFIANALPWWRWGQPGFAAVALAGCLILAAATTIAARRSLSAALLVVPAFSFVALAVDQLTGSHLQLSAPLGDNPIVAGRFSGMGNLDFAVMATSALLIAGVLGGRLPRRWALLSASAIAVVAVVIDGAPQLGNDIGGVLALVPSAIVVVALVARVRASPLRVVTAAVAAIAVAVVVALADYSRPATSQTHVGRFVGQVLHGGAGTEVHRKLDSVFASFGLTVGTFVFAATVVIAVVARNRIRRALATSNGVSAAAAGVVVLAVLGTALNDSGITVAAMAAIVGISVVYGAGLSGDTSSEPTAK